MSRVVPCILLLSLPAAAANVEAGATAFADSCARCHAATQVHDGERGPRVDRANARPGAGPDLSEALVKSGWDATRAFIVAPQQKLPGTTCDTRTLPADAIDDVMAYLVARATPEPADRKQRLKQSLERDQQAAAQAGVPTRRASRRGGGK